MPEPIRKNHMTAAEEAVFEKKAEKMLAGQRELIPGRNFLWNRLHSLTKSNMENFRENFVNTFPNAPGNNF